MAGSGLAEQSRSSTTTQSSSFREEHNIFAPGFTPKPSQAHDLEVLRENDYVGLLNIATGYGKTVVACMAAVESKSKVVLIIAPESTHRKETSAWRKDAKLVANVEVRVVGNKNKAQKQALSDLEWGIPGWYVITPQLFTRRDTSHWSGDMLIVDESHQLSNPGSKGQRSLSGFELDGSDMPINTRFRYRLALSATPFRNHFERAWSTCRLLWPHLDARDEISDINPWTWKNDRMTSEIITTSNVDPRTGKKKKATNFLAEAEPGKLISEMPCVIQHFKRERCCDFHPEGFLDLEEPAKITRDVVISPEQEKILEDLEEQSLAWLEENPLIVEFPIVMHQRIRQVALGVPTLNPKPPKEDGTPQWDLTYDINCKSPLMDEVVAYVEQLEDEPFMVFLESQRFIPVVVHRLAQAGIVAKEYSGKSKADLADFGKGYQALVGQVASIGTGTDGLQAVTNTELWLQRSLDETTNEQTEGRADRTGQTRQVQRVSFMDDKGLFLGQLNKAIQNRLELNRSSRRAV